MFDKGKFWSYFAYAIGEILLIVVGILIALYLQNRNETKKTEVMVTTTLNIIKTEINKNKKSIELAIDYHDLLRDTLPKVTPPKNEEEIKSKLGFWRGMGTERLQNSAFQTCIQSGVSREFNTELLQSLNELYTLQESYNKYNENSMQIFFNADFSDIDNFKKIMASVYTVISDLEYSEGNLLSNYNTCLQKIDSVQKVK